MPHHARSDIYFRKAMKRRSKRWLSLGLIVLASATLAGEPVPMSVQVKSGQVLDTPSFLGKVIARVNYGDRIPVLEQQGDWSKVTAPDGTGNVSVVRFVVVPATNWLLVVPKYSG